MKIINLLQRIANSEEVPIFKYEGRTYKYDENLDMFIDINNELICKNVIYFCELNDEVEIIEEDKKIEPLKLNNSDVWTGKTNKDLIADKINEIIKKLNKEE